MLPLEIRRRTREMSPIDARHRLKERPFEYKIYKNSTIQIYHEHKPVMILKESQARMLMEKLKGADEDEVQLILAKITGNFKRGNERTFHK